MSSLAHQPQTIGDFSVFNASAYALSSADLLEILFTQSQLQKLYYELQKVTLQTEGQSAEGLSKGIYESTLDEATSLRRQADATIAYGSINLGMEGIGNHLLTGRFKQSSYEEFSKANEGLKNLDSYENKISTLESPEGNPIKVTLEEREEVLSARKTSMEEIEEQLQKIDPAKKSLETAHEDETLQLAQATRHPEYERFKDRIRTERKARQKNRDRAESEIERFRMKMSNITQGLSYLLQGSLNAAASVYKVHQAEVDSLKQLIQYAYDAVHRTTDLTNKGIDGVESDKASTIRVLEGVASTNRV